MVNMGCSGGLERLYMTMREKLRAASEDDPNPNVRCTFCTRKERLVDFEDLKPGDHIAFGGKHLLFNVGERQIKFYKHHAIVKKSKKVNKTSGIATLIHFYSVSFHEAIQIRETDEMLDLHKYEIYRVRYCHETHRPEKIIERAEMLVMAEQKYNLITCNCEHFCHWCCIGNADSYQVNDLFSVLRQIGTGTLNLGGKIGKVIASVIMVSFDDIAKAGWKGACCIGVPWGIVSVFALAYLIYCIYRHRCLNRDKALGQVCARCCTQEKLDLWLKFFVYCATQAGGIGLLSLVIAAGASNGIVAGGVAVISILSIALMWGIPKLKNSLRSPFRGQKVKVDTTDNIWIGDVISFQYGLKMHDGIVSKVEKTSNKKAKLSVIHYSTPSVIGRRIVQEDIIEIDLRNDVIIGHNYSGYDVHPPEVVVQRARQRLGETKFGMCSNRSCHFCYWAKVKEDVDEEPEENPAPTPVLKFKRSIMIGEDISALQKVNVDHRRNRSHATKTMDKTWARIPQEVKEGSVIQFKYGPRGMWHYAVTTHVQFPEEPSSMLSVTVIHYGEKSRPCEESFDFDLRHDDIWIYKYHPIYRYSRKDVVRRARARIGKGDYNILYHRSSHLAKEIVRKDEDERVTNFDMLSPGDVIMFYYWPLNNKHAAIVTKIGASTSKGNNRAHVTVIHYALDKLFRRKIITEEDILLDLSRDHVYRRNYEDVTYPPNMVIKRARSRLNERRYAFNDNSSNDLAHWAKVVQSPAEVTIHMNENTVTTSCTDESIALLPGVGKVYGHFQKVPIHAWGDLQPGIIIEYKYYWIPHQGILIDVDYKGEKITVIHYGTKTIFSTRTIMKDTIRVDLRRDRLSMYRCDPTKCNCPKLIVAKAYERLGEKKWGRKHRSWDFCKDCVLKKNTS